MDIDDVVQFNENHKWCGALGIITEVKNCGKNGIRYMVGVPIPLKGIAYIFVMDNENVIEFVGKSKLSPINKED